MTADLRITRKDAKSFLCNNLKSCAHAEFSYFVPILYCSLPSAVVFSGQILATWVAGFKSCSHRRKIEVLPFFPIPYHRVYAVCCYFCPCIGQLGMKSHYFVSDRLTGVYAGHFDHPTQVAHVWNPVCFTASFNFAFSNVGCGRRQPRLCFSSISKIS